MRRTSTLYWGLAALVISLLTPSAASAAAAPTEEPVEVAAAVPVPALPTAVVALGDSYISGEGGRWEGNHYSDYGNRRSTDRAAYRSRWGFWRYSQGRVYGPSAYSGCHRSDVAPVLSSGLAGAGGVDGAVTTTINLACSGARTVNLFRSSQGGEGMKGERSQADKLAEVATGHDIEMVVVSIGGNDLGFGDIILDCALDYMVSNSWWQRTCHDDQQRNIDRRMERAMDDVGRALDEIRAVLADAGQGPDGYRLVLQSYPSPVPSGDEFRYSQGSWSRTFVGGCPFWNVDATWARDTFVPHLAGNLAAVAASRGAEFLDLQDALDGREICAEGVSQGDDDDAEWSRYLSTGVLQGEAQESLHPQRLRPAGHGPLPPAPLRRRPRRLRLHQHPRFRPPGHGAGRPLARTPGEVWSFTRDYHRESPKPRRRRSRSGLVDRDVVPTSLNPLS